MSLTGTCDNKGHSGAGVLANANMAMTTDYTNRSTFGAMDTMTMNHFLKKFSFKNVRRDDLWQAFDEVIETVPGPNNKRLDMLDFGNQWTTQMGFPLVTVRTFNSTAVIITQEKYMLNTSNLGLAKYRSPHYG
ncbi:hypothetical protein NECAME_18002 [Necator americanus]|uniref:Peptidase M1 membrane alanine aminopeptidase domain-containing protein n=1 Tax=Necator americanus TaxID=51031 RepID=W2TF78_NECAM|nr:hypothetical protein NECAME_18002 [Necator americanus]ETN80488.1 hypothetical protein NECAME_18002 [Necator americanus]